MHRFIALLSLLLSSTLFAQTPPAFTYQGHFLDEGLPAQGNYDITIRIYNQELGGTLLASAQVLDANIIDGLFSITIPTEVPPGTPLFAADDRWIEIGFRDGDKSIFDPFTFLPRQLARYTPLAAHATRAEHALVADELSDPIWTRVGFAEHIVAGGGINNFYLNTESGIGNAVFIAHRVTEGQNSAAISTSGDDGEPSLDFLTGFNNGTPVSNSFKLKFEGSTSIFRFINNNGNDVARFVPNIGLEILQGGVTASDFEYTAPETRRLNIPAAAWIPTTNVEYNLTSTNNGLRSYISESSTTARRMIAPVSLPDGAVIQSVKFYYGLNAGGEVDLSLIRGTNTGSGFAFVAFAEDLTQAIPSPQTINADPLAAIVDNGIFQYFLNASSSNWGSFPAVTLGPVVITYTVSEPD
ncbi:MAG: hypothetical protein JJ974_12420 [Phycisphaerales bacterium]|nr:hypothetical protein [Phycisphaerales bacterium]